MLLFVKMHFFKYGMYKTQVNLSLHYLIFLTLLRVSFCTHHAMVADIQINTNIKNHSLWLLQFQTNSIQFYEDYL